jgi:hypothetical protein
MTDDEELENRHDALIEEYQLFLRGQGPEPDLSDLPPRRREAIRKQFKIVKALADRRPGSPPLEQDPVAIRLGLVGPGSSSSALLLPGARYQDATGGEVLEASLDEVAFRFQGRIAVERAPTWSPDSPEGLRAVAQCSVLAEAVAVFVGGLDAQELPDRLTRFFRLRPEVSAACVSSPDAERAVVFTPADATRSLDPVLGWLDPHRPKSSEPLALALSRFFEQRLPRWDRMAAADVFATMEEFDAEAAVVLDSEIASAMRARPRLAFRKDGQRVLAEIDPERMVSLVVAVQTGDLDPGELVEELTELAGAGAS